MPALGATASRSWALQSLPVRWATCGSAGKGFGSSDDHYAGGAAEHGQAGGDRSGDGQCDGNVLGLAGDGEWHQGWLIEENFGMKFYGHYGEQAGFVSHLSVRSESRTACLIAINTNATNATNAIVSGQRSADNSPNTMRLVREIREYLFTRIFPLFPPVVAP